MLTQEDIERTQKVDRDRIAGELKVEAIKAVLTMFDGINSDEIFPIIDKIIKKNLPKEILENIPVFCSRFNNNNPYKGAMIKAIHGRGKEEKDKPLNEEISEAFTDSIVKSIDLAVLNEVLDEEYIRKKK